MTDPLTHLAAALNAAQRDAEAAGEDGTPVWSIGRHHAVRDENGEAVAYNEGRPTEAQAAHIARHDPASTLRRIAADRKILAEYEKARAEFKPDDRPWDSESGADLARTRTLQDAVRYLAEGYGWTETGQR